MDDEAEPIGTEGRARLAAGALAVLLVGATLTWAQTGNVGSPGAAGLRLDRALAAVNPMSIAAAIGEAVRRADFSAMNWPWRSVGVWLIWWWAVLTAGRWTLVVLDWATFGDGSDSRDSRDSHVSRAGGMRGVSAAGTTRGIAMTFGAGFVTLGLCVLGAGVVGLAGWPLTAGVLAVAAVGAARAADRDATWRLIRAAWPWGGGVPALGARRVAGRRDWLVDATVGAAALGWFASVVAAMTPPIQSDAMRYHLAAPQEWLRAGRIVWLPGNAFSNFPFLPEMHFLVGLAAGAPETAALMHATCALMAAAAVAALAGLVAPGAGGRAGEGARRLVGAAYLTVPAGLVLAGWPFIDHAVALFFALSTLATLGAMTRGGAARWVLAGLMTGGALGTKYTALVHAVVLCGVVAVDWFAFAPPGVSLSRRRPRWRHIAMAAGVAAAVGGVWYAKSVVVAGNPVYPLANGLFRGGDWTAHSARLYAGKAASKGFDKNFPNLMLAPRDSLMEWRRFEGHWLGATWTLAVACVLGGLAVAAVSRWRRRADSWRPMAGAAAVAGAYFVTWFYTYQSNRMLLPMLALTLPLGAGLLTGGWRRARGRGVGRGVSLGVADWPFRVSGGLARSAVAAAVVAGGLWSAQWNFARAPSPPALGYLLGSMSRDQYLDRALNSHRPFRETARLAGTTATVLLVGEHRAYGAAFRPVWSDWFDTPAVLRIMRESGATTPGALLAELRRRGIGWMLVNDAELDAGNQREMFYRPRFSEAEYVVAEGLYALPGVAKVIPFATGARLFRL